MMVDAPCGTMEGTKRGRMIRFLGIPYAEPPVGGRRFLPPESLPRWAGTRDCKRPGPAAPQTALPGMAYLTKNEAMAEDCLYLNVMTPDIGGRAPVLFWLHGGAFQRGSAFLGLRPEVFTAAGFVVVSCNYRLGALGFLDVSGFLGERYRQSGNSGLLDAAAALRWTRDNIEAFGGDPERVTVMGQSAGAKLAAALTLMPSAAGLFRGAVLSGGAAQCIRDRQTARREAERFLLAAGSPARAEALLFLPWRDILRAQEAAFSWPRLHALGPVFDGVTFPGEDALSLAGRGARPAALLIGTNRDEMELYWQTRSLRDLKKETAEALFGNRAPVVLDAFRAVPRDGAFHERFVHFLTEYVFRAGAVRMAEAAADAGTPVYLYRLDWDRQALRACHASETQFFMGLGLVVRDTERSPAHEQLGRAMREALFSFIRTGRPEADGLSPWPRFEKETRQMMIFDAPCRLERAPAPETAKAMPYAVYGLD